MSLILFYHPLASFCHKVLIALYENDTAFTGEVIRHDMPADRATLLEAWPVGKMPVLRDEERAQTIPESSVIIEYLDTHYPGARALLPRTTDEALQARLWDRFFDNYVQVPMQKHVADRLRAPEHRDPWGVGEAAATLDTAYGMLEAHLEGRTWMLGEAFSMADCAAAPALFYAGVIHPFPDSAKRIRDYFGRLMARPSVQRTYEEAKPFVQYFPYRAEMPAGWGGVDWPTD
jgi:glutathione S-transferase